jgi:hypothetical protein
MADLSRPDADNNNAEQPWTTVQTKRNSSIMTKEEIEHTTLTKTKLSITIRVPNDPPADFSAAEQHIATLRELSKQDANLIVLNSTGDAQVNIHKAFGHEKYKNFFCPREKNFATGGGQVSISHYVLSETKSFNKALMMPFLRNNKTFIYFNPKDGLEHFAAIGVLFGPHPDYTWRQTITDSLEQTMKAELTEDEKEKLSSSSKNAKLVISLIPQKVNNNRHSKINTIALEVRVPAEHERIYTNILDRLNERASLLEKGEVDIVLDPKIGNFFPYYAKNDRPELFDKLMRKQNAALQSTSVIPIFGFTEEARYQRVQFNRVDTPLLSALMSHPNILKIEPTASSAEIGKYLIIIERYMRDDIEYFIDNLLSSTPNLKESIGSFKKPQRGGNAFKQNRINNISSFLDKLEQSVNDETMMYADDDEATSPPVRPRKLTISYAQATKRLSFNNESVLSPPTNTITTNKTQPATASTITKSSIEETISMIRTETQTAIAALRTELRQEIGTMEDRIANKVISAVQKAVPTHEINTTGNDINSNYSTAMESTNTVTTLSDKVDALAEIV